nr:MAG TPA: hypothetical protein [Caudoviricetes sp.]
MVASTKGLFSFAFGSAYCPTFLLFWVNSLTLIIFYHG